MKSWISNAMRAGAGFVGALLAATAALLMGARLGLRRHRPGRRTGEIDFQGAASPVMESIHSFHTFLLVIIIAVVLLVARACSSVVMVKFNEQANPVPSRTTHNTLIEVAWTVVPVLILVAIAISSFRLLFLQLDIAEGGHDGEDHRPPVVLVL